MSIQLFEVPFFHYSQDVLSNLRSKIQRTGREELVDEDAFVEKMSSSHKLVEVSVDWDSMVALPDHREEESTYRDAFGDTRRVVTPIYTFEVNYSGSSKLLEICPSSSRVVQIEVEVSSDKFTFEIQGDDKGRLEQIKDGIKINVNNLNKELGNFNSQLEAAVRNAVDQRKQELAKHDEGLSAFGVPIKSSRDS